MHVPACHQKTARRRYSPRTCAVMVKYPRTKEEERGDRAAWPWLPGTIVQQCGPDEWQVCVEDMAVAVRAGRQQAHSPHAEEQAVLPAVLPRRQRDQAAGCPVNRPLPRWPLYLIASPAAVAVWSGWVGLGTLCGFGVVHPLPGIADGFTINTAITLPVGVEAYGAYALRAWLTPGASETARKFARWSAIGSLALGMLGQVVYHLLSAAHATRAPWPVVVLVSCLPVVTLGFGAALTHLLRDTAADDVPDGCVYPRARRGMPGQWHRPCPTSCLTPCPRSRSRQWLGVLDVGRATIPSGLSAGTRPTWQTAKCRTLRGCDARPQHRPGPGSGSPGAPRQRRQR